MNTATLARRRTAAAPMIVVAAGVSAALHLGKLAPAVPALQAALGVTLVQAGFLLSLVQFAGMTLGLLAGLAADRLGLRRSMLIGLVLLTLAGAAGGWVDRFAGSVAWLLGLRAIEGAGFLLVVMPGPGLIRALSAPGGEKAALGLWGAYMPLGVALSLLCGPAWIAWWGWSAWWWVTALGSAVAAVAVACLLPADPPRHVLVQPGDAPGLLAPVRRTLAAGGPWLTALLFAAYSAQWMAVIGFLPTIYAAAGVSAGPMAVLTAGAAAMNIVGNVVGGRLLQNGWAPLALLRIGFVVMALGSLATFVEWSSGGVPAGLSPTVRYLAVCAFSLFGGMVPVTLFLLNVRLAPGPSMVSTSIGLMQQSSALGQFIAPPVVAWIAYRAGGWQWTWALTCACSLVGIVLTLGLGRLLNGRRVA